MLITVLHTGQSGVERGADRAARLLGIAVEGICPTGSRDELGVLPAEISRDLTPHEVPGVRNALRATLARADALIIAIPDIRRASEMTGVDQLRRTSKARGIPVWVVDPTTNLDAVTAELQRLVAKPHVNLMVTGPRRSRWNEGDRLGGRIVADVSNYVGTAPKKHRVLVIDDEPDTAQSACDFVQALGHTCVIALDGAAALRLANEHKPDVAFLDIRLPDATGYDIARKLRETQGAPLFLAAITGSAEGMDREEAIRAGFDRHVVKPATGRVIERLLSDATATLAS